MATRSGKNSHPTPTVPVTMTTSLTMEPVVETSNKQEQKRKKIAIIGGGCAGVSTAWSLARSLGTKAEADNVDDDDQGIDVTIIEPCAVLGGVACTKYMGAALDFGGDGGGDGGEHHQQQREQPFINYGVQGGAPASHRNILAMLHEFGEDVDAANLSVSFGKGEYHWTNYQDSDLQRRLKDDIERFGTLLKWISRLEFITLFLSIETVLKWTSLSQEFRERMVYPLVALFFGTGNQTHNMSAAIVARVFTDPSLRLFEYSEDRLIDSEPTNFAFGNLDYFYNGKVRPYLETRGVRILTSHCVDQVLQRDAKAGGGVTLRISKVSVDDTDYRAGGDQKALREPTTTASTASTSSNDNSSSSSSNNNKSSWTECFDDIVLACPANVSLKVLGEHATFWERHVLSSVEYFRDLSVTHCDQSYMKKHFEVDNKAIYFIKTYKEDAKLLEMGFDLSGYQSNIARGVSLSSKGERDKEKDHPPERVYQTIFLDQKRHNNLWSITELDESKVIDKSWWSAFAHTMTHFRCVVPFVWLLHRQSTVNKTHTYYAGSWMLINTHDIAVLSGLAVAERLGAPYPFANNDLALEAYKTFWNVGHLTAPRRRVET